MIVAFTHYFKIIYYSVKKIIEWRLVEMRCKSKHILKTQSYRAFWCLQDRGQSGVRCILPVT